MHSIRFRTLCHSIVITCSLAASGAAQAVPLISNGGFESGFSSWSTADLAGGSGSFFIQSGTLSPVNGSSVPAPPGGVQAAMSDGDAPGSHALYQDFVVPLGVSSATIHFELFVGNEAPDFYVPSTGSLNFGIADFNQQARIDILVGSADPFSVAAADILQNLFQTLSGDPLVRGYFPVDVDISALLAAHGGETLRLRIAETDNFAAFQFGVDNVSLNADATVPEPATALLLLGGLAGWRATARRSLSA